MLGYKDILQCIEGYILVIDKKSGEIAFSNSLDATEIYKKYGTKTKTNIIDFNEKYYSIETKNFVKGEGEYLYIHYHDITNIFEYEQSLLKKAMTDSLTRICNRRGIEHAIENFRKSLTTSCVVYADIDFFKKINDTYSHEAGDFVLSEVAKIFSDSIREDDLVGRMGGEEFLIVLNSTNIEMAKPKIEAIREAIKSHVFNWEENQIKLTVSFGVSEFTPGKDSNFERTILEADKALYCSKEHGRDKITYFNKKEFEDKNPEKSLGSRK